MKKFVFAVVVCVLICNVSGFAQDSARVLNKNAVMFEAGGNGVAFSLSYERMFYQKNNIRLCGRAGLGILPAPDDVIWPFVEASLLFGKSKGFFETGLGYTYDGQPNFYYTYFTNEGRIRHTYYHHFLILRLGYRYQSMNGFMFRAAATPAIYMQPGEVNNEWNRNHSLRITPWLGLSFGYSF